MKFGYTIIYVADVEATIKFYKEAFSLDVAFIHDSKQYGELNTGNTKLAFASETLAHSNSVEFIKNRPTQIAAGFEIAFISENITEAFQQALAAGAILIKKPEMKPWGQTVGYLRDINGIIIEICSLI